MSWLPHHLIRNKRWVAPFEFRELSNICGVLVSGRCQADAQDHLGPGKTKTAVRAGIEVKK